jgi:hypothetical protein
MSTPGAVSARPWYREPWPWLLMLPPVLSVAGGVAMVYLALDTPTELAVADYARIEEVTADRFARDTRAAELGLTAEVAFAPAGEGRATVTVTLATPANEAPPAAVRLELQHAALRAHDIAVTLGRARDGAANVYAGEIALAPGHYGVEIGSLDLEWRLAGVLTQLPQALRLTAQGGTG